MEYDLWYVYGIRIIKACPVKPLAFCLQGCLVLTNVKPGI